MIQQHKETVCLFASRLVVWPVGRLARILAIMKRHRLVFAARVSRVMCTLVWNFKGAFESKQPPVGELVNVMVGQSQS